MMASSKPNDTMEWLLGDEQPSIRCLALRQLLGRREDDPDVQAARNRIPRTGWAAEILSEQLPGGYWNNNEKLNRPKYLATYWKFLVLVELGLTGTDERLKTTSSLLLDKCGRPDGGFSFWEMSHFCVTGSITQSLITSGLEDGRITRALDWIVDSQKDDGGWHCFPSKTGTLDCWEGLFAFAALPKSKWTRRMTKSAERGAEFFLERKLFQEGETRYEPWFRFHFPTHYYYDILVGLDILTSLGYADDRRLRPALEALMRRQTVDGKWVLDAVHPDVDGEAKEGYMKYEPHWPIPFVLEKVGEPSKMITLRALRVLARVNRQS